MRTLDEEESDGSIIRYNDRAVSLTHNESNELVSFILDTIKEMDEDWLMELLHDDNSRGVTEAVLLLQEFNLLKYHNERGVTINPSEDFNHSADIELAVADSEHWFDERGFSYEDIWVDDPVADPMTMCADMIDPVGIDELENDGNVIMDGATFGPRSDETMRLIFWYDA